MSGSIQRLAPDGTQWEWLGQLEQPRFFHRSLPWDTRGLEVVVGIHKATGKVERLE
jgi:hypothetical protein